MDVEGLIKCYKRRIWNYLHSPQIFDYRCTEIFELLVGIKACIKCVKDIDPDSRNTFKEEINYVEELETYLENKENYQQYFQPPISHLDLENKRIIICINTDNENKLDDIDLMYNIILSSQANYNLCIFTCFDESHIKEFFKSIGGIATRKKMMSYVQYITETDVTLLREEIENEFQTMEKPPALPISDANYLREYQKDICRDIQKPKKPISIKMPCGTGKTRILIYDIFRHQENSIILIPLLSLIQQIINNIKEYCSIHNVSIPNIEVLSSSKLQKYSISSDNPLKIIIAVYNSFYNKILKEYFLTHEDMCKDYKYVYIDEAHHVVMPSNRMTMKKVLDVLNKYDDVNESDNENNTENNSTNNSINNSIKNNTTNISENNAENTANNTTAENNTTNNTTNNGAENTNNKTTTTETTIKDDYATKLSDDKDMKKAYSTAIVKYIKDTSKKSIYFSATLDDKLSKLTIFMCPMTMFGAIKQNLLVPLNVMLVAVPKDGREEHCVKFIKENGFHHAIIYTRTQNDARKITEILNHKKIPTECVISGDKEININKAFDNFRESKTNVLCTVNCVSEGVNLPIADTAIFYSNKKSIISIIQCVGRVMRKDDNSGKTHAQLILFCDEETEFEETYTKTLHTLNGDLGYGKVDLFNAIEFKNEIKELKPKPETKRWKHFVEILYKYNKELFDNIEDDYNAKLRKYILNVKSKNKDLEEAHTGGIISNADYLFVKDHMNELNIDAKDVN